MSIKSISIAIIALVLSTSVNAVVVNTLNGVDYEWVELTETQGLSLAEVNQRLANANDVLFGYQYASRQQVQDLLSSYMPWDGVDGHHGAPSVTEGLDQFLADFGTLHEGPIQQTQAFDTVDGYTIAMDSLATYSRANGLYGTPDECGGAYSVCISQLSLYRDDSGTGITTYLTGSASGLDASNTNPLDAGWTYYYHDVGSYLVRTTVVPVPAAVWLFGSGLIGLIGVARRKKI